MFITSFSAEVTPFVSTRPMRSEKSCESKSQSDEMCRIIIVVTYGSLIWRGLSKSLTMEVNRKSVIIFVL